MTQGESPISAHLIDRAEHVAAARGETVDDVVFRALADYVADRAPWWKRLIIGKTGTHCAECGEPVSPGDEVRLSPVQVYCSEEHAAADQQNNPL